MKSGNELFSETEKLDNAFFLTLKERQCAVNPYIASFMSEMILKAKTDEEIQKRLLKVSLVALEIIGTGNPCDKDYIRVSKETIEIAKKSEKQFDIDSIRKEDWAFAHAIDEAKFQTTNLNDIFNEFYKTNIETRYIWEQIEIFLKAYWIEKKKHK